MRMSLWKLILSMLPLFYGQVALAITVSSEMQRTVRGATFEVVQKKPDKDPLSYEKPLPLELLPYLERTDVYRSIGTAFALGNNTYVTAGHVLAAAVVSQYGPPALRTSDGRVYLVDKILKYSAHEDFVVFSLLDDPKPSALIPSRSAQIDDAVLAVGNALGEGIVIREGLFTSETPEDQDGRWKWIRFSAAASPGNSGGPILDGEGRVIGIVIGKSPNENLNYALPIGRVLDAPANLAQFDERNLRYLPLLKATMTYQFKDSFVLPKKWSEFSSSYLQTINVHNAKSREQLLATNQDSLFPNGRGAESILYDAISAYEMRLIGQNSDKSWEMFDPNYFKTDLAEDGFVSMASVADAVLLRLRRPANASDAGFYDNSHAFMDMALHGLNLTRQVGTDAVKITSLGAAQSDAMYLDSYGRSWQRRVWAVPFLDLYVVALLLPTPDGYAALLTYTPSLLLKEANDRLDWTAQSAFLSYRGTLLQWRTFLSRRDMLPESLKSFVLSTDPKKQSWRIAAPNAALNITPEVVELNDNSILGMEMGYVVQGSKTEWIPQGISIAEDETRKRYVELVRRLKVPATAPRELRDDWQDLMQKRSPYSGSPAREAADSWTSKSVIDVVSGQSQDLADNVVYLLTSHVENVTNQNAPQVMLEASRRAVQIFEKGTGGRAAAINLRPPAGDEAQLDKVIDKMITDMVASFNERSAPGARDIRNRQFEDDIQGYIFSSDERNEMKRLMRADAAARASGVQANRDFVESEYRTHMRKVFEQMDALANYWSVVAQIGALRESWSGFLIRNGLSDAQPHSAQVQAVEAHLLAARGEYLHRAPDDQMFEITASLVRAYFNERREMLDALSDKVDIDALRFTPSGSSCSTGASDRGRQYEIKPEVDAKINLVASKTPDKYYPASSVRSGQTGSAVIAAHLDESGCVVESAIVASTGMQELDDAALRYANDGVSFYPASKAGKPVPVVKKFVVQFMEQVR